MGGVEIWRSASEPRGLTAELAAADSVCVQQLLSGITRREVDVDKEDAAGIRGVRRAHDCGLGVGVMYEQRARGQGCAVYSGGCMRLQPRASTH